VARAPDRCNRIGSSRVSGNLNSTKCGTVLCCKRRKCWDRREVHALIGQK
jgi:hypothetical protein